MQRSWTKPLLRRLGLAAIAAVAFAGCRPKPATQADVESVQDNGQRFVVEVLKPRVFWRATSGDQDGREIPLESADSEATTLAATASLRCLDGGKVKIFTLPEVVVYEGSDWTRLASLVKPQSELAVQAQQGLLRTAGRPRGEPETKTTISSPQEHSLIWPDSLVIRWTPPASGKQVTLTVKSSPKGVGWTRSGVDGAAGAIEDAALREALRRWRDEHGAGANRLTLIFQIAGQRPAEVAFDVLSRKKEERLTRALQECADEAGGSMLHLARAEVFHHFQLLPESANEYELALERDPEDRLVRQRAVEAYRMMNDVHRAAALERR